MKKGFYKQEGILIHAAGERLAKKTSQCLQSKYARASYFFCTSVVLRRGICFAVLIIDATQRPSLRMTEVPCCKFTGVSATKQQAVV